MLKSKLLATNEIDWIGVRFLDPIGRVFKINGEYYRAIYPKAKVYVERLLDSGLLKELHLKGLIVETEVSDLHLDDYPIVLKHKGQGRRFSTNCPSRTLRNAALVWIEINLELAEYGLGLIDGHMANFILEGKNSPKWCDIGSIQPLTKINQGISEFRRMLFNPLLLMNHDVELRRIGRALCSSGGVSERELQLMGVNPTPSSSFANRCWNFLRYWKDRILRPEEDLLPKSEYLVWPQLDSKTIATRRKLIRKLKKQLQDKDIDAKTADTVWSRYTSTNALEKALLCETELGDPAKVSNRLAYFNRFIQDMRPETVLDLGANAGIFALSAAAQGSKVIAVDMDEDSLNFLDYFLKSVQIELRIDVVLHDVLYLDDSYRADFVSAMALTHHLALSQKFPLEFIVKKFSELSNYSLITEFMPMGLGTKGKIKPSPLPKSYSLDNLTNALKTHFINVEILDYQMPESYSKRIMVQCWERR